MNTIFRNWFRKGKNRIARRLDKQRHISSLQPMFSASNIHYDVSDRIHAINCGGIGVIHALVRRIGLMETIDDRLHLLKFHRPYHESDHVLGIAYNALCGGACLQDIELRRNDEAFLDALGTRRIPDPTTAGDFCRRFARRVSRRSLMLSTRRGCGSGPGSPTPSSTVPTSTRTAAWWKPPASARRGWTSPTTACGVITP